MSNLTKYRLLPEQMIEDLGPFMERVAGLAADIGIDTRSFQRDHIALRINELALAEQAHQAWLAWGEEISSALINGRPIIVLRFKQPLMTAVGPIECLELPYPAQGKDYPQQGWEHIELVIPSTAQTADGYLADLRKRFEALDEQWSKLATLGITTKLSSPKGEGERLMNPTLAFKRDGVCIKLHPHSLQRVVLSEQA